MLFRVRYLPDIRKQVYACSNCRRELEVIGTIVEMHACKVNPTSEDREWVKVPSWRIKSIEAQ